MVAYNYPVTCLFLLRFVLFLCCIQFPSLCLSCISKNALCGCDLVSATKWSTPFAVHRHRKLQWWRRQSEGVVLCFGQPCFCWAAGWHESTRSECQVAWLRFESAFCAFETQITCDIHCSVVIVVIMWWWPRHTEHSDTLVCPVQPRQKLLAKFGLQLVALPAS